MDPMTACGAALFVLLVSYNRTGCKTSEFASNHHNIIENPRNQESDSAQQTRDIHNGHQRNCIAIEVPPEV